MFFPLASINNNALIMVYQNLNDDQNRDVANANKIGEIKHKLTLQRGLMRTAESTRGSQITGKREAHPFSAPSPFSLLRSEQSSVQGMIVDLMNYELRAHFPHLLHCHHFSISINTIP